MSECGEGFWAELAGVRVGGGGKAKQDEVSVLLWLTGMLVAPFSSAFISVPAW